MPRNRLVSFLLVGLTLLLAVLVLTDWLPGLRGPAVGTGEWYWRYGLRPVARWWAAVLAAVGLGLWGWLGVKKGELGGTLGTRGNSRGRFGIWDLGFGRLRWWLAGLVVGSLAVQLGVVYAHRGAVAAELVDRTLSNESNGYFTMAVETADMGDLLRHFPERMPVLPSEHTRTHPPGLIWGQWLTIRAMSAVPGLAEPIAGWVRPLRCIDVWYLDQENEVLAALGVWAFLPLVAGALTVVPVYGLGRRLYGERAGRLAAVLAAGLPALLVFAPTPDQLFALLAAGTVLAWLVAWERGSGWYALLAGVFLSLATFLSLGNGALALVVVVLSVLRIAYSVKRDNTQYAIHNTLVQHLKLLALFFVGLSLLWLVYWIGWGVAPWEVARVGLDQHYALVTSQRRYGWWVGYNLVDLLLFAGPVVVGGFVVGVVKAGRRVVGGADGAADYLALALGLLLVVLDVSGTARGEVGRLWLFLMPLLCVVAGYTLSPDPSPSEGEGKLLGLVIAAQLALGVSLGVGWRPMEAVMVVVERPVMVASEPEEPVDVVFGEAIRLVGYRVADEKVTAGQTLAFTLYWQREGRVERPYTVFTHLVDETGTLVAQQDNWPVQGQWPPTCWQRGEVVVDAYEMVLPEELRPGQYTLLVGLYDARDGGRLVTAGGADHLSLLEIEVQE